MHASKLFATLASIGLASCLPSDHTLQRRSGCGYTPGQKNGDDWTTSSLFLLRVEDNSDNSTLGYLNAFSSDYAVVSSRASASSGFVAPYYNGYGSLIFWAGANSTDRAFTAEETLLPNASSTLPVTTLVSTQPDGEKDCGTAPVYLHSKYTNTGSCVFGGDDVDVHFRCPFPGTINDTPQPCYAQSYYACSGTGLAGVSNNQSVIFFGNATTAVPHAGCRSVDLVSECP